MISATGSPLSALTSTYGTAGSTQSFTLSGANMTAGITVTPPAGLEVSTMSDFSSNVGTSGSPITVGSAGTIASTTIYVRMAATAPVSGSYNSQNIVLSSSGATSVNVATASSGNAVTKATLTVTADDKQRYVGEANPVFTATITGYVNDETISVVSGAPALSTTADGASPAGEYTITCGVGTLNADNYSFTPVNGTLIVSNHVGTLIMFLGE